MAEDTVIQATLVDDVRRGLRTECFVEWNQDTGIVVT